MAARLTALGRAVAIPVAAALLAACSTSPERTSAPATTTVATAPTTTAAAAAAVAATTTAAATTTTVVPPTTVAAVPDSTFTGTVVVVSAADLGSSWRPGCPVAPDALRLLRLSYWGFDDQAHTGSIVVAAGVSAAVLDVFRTLYDQRFPIRRMEPVDVFGSDDDASMAADNTSGFNCRQAVATGPPHWSNHAFGLAVDVNPIENPYLLAGQVLPPAGADFLDRSVYRPGMAVAGGVLTKAFAAAGWGWGGTWDSPDYQHFSANGG